ncbi:MAG: fructosamine kinase family protein [Candidatus Promineifilaceae bacterium]
MDLAEKIKEITGQSVTSVEPLSGGCIGEVYRVRLVDGSSVVAKMEDGPRPQLAVEGYMLRYLAENSQLPVPAVLHSEPGFLLMTYLPGRNHFSADAQRHAAVLLAALHNISSTQYGLEQDTLIGGLHQPNALNDSWLDFFREQRLLYMGRQGLESGRLPAAVFSRLELLCRRLERWLVEPEQPSLIHGDAWSGNILAASDRITGFVDPAIYYADAEIELAFTTLFGTFGEPFFERYTSIRPIAPGFFEERRNLYNLYPLLVHVRLFGGSYVSSVERTLRQFGA